MQRRHFLSSSGLAILETSVIMLVVAGIFIAGFGVVDYLHWLRFAHQVAERSLGDSGVKPLRWDDASSAAAFDTAAIDSYLAQIKTAAQAELLAGGLDVSKLFAEFVVCPVSVDAVSGQATALQSTSCRRELLGSLPVSSALLAKTDLEHRFTQEISQNASPGPGQPQQASLLAQPSGLFGWHSQAFLPISVLAGARIFISVQGSLAALAYSDFAADSTVYATRVVHLRGLMQ